jgi:pilus assembly protein CpaE
VKRDPARLKIFRSDLVRRCSQHLKTAGKRLLREQKGVSALEFALFAPLLLLGSLSVADLAFLAYQRMAIDQVLRAGAQQAMLDKSKSPAAQDVIKVLNVMAAENFAVGSTASVNGKPPLILEASRYCVCPDAVEGPHEDCSKICPSTKATLAFYSITAQSRSSSMLLPNVTFKPQIRVQVR